MRQSCRSGANQIWIRIDEPPHSFLSQCAHSTASSVRPSRRQRSCVMNKCTQCLYRTLQQFNSQPHQKYSASPRNKEILSDTEKPTTCTITGSSRPCCSVGQAAQHSADLPQTCQKRRSSAAHCTATVDRQTTTPRRQLCERVTVYVDPGRRLVPSTVYTTVFVP